MARTNTSFLKHTFQSGSLRPNFFKYFPMDTNGCGKQRTSAGDSTQLGQNGCCEQRTSAGDSTQRGQNGCGEQRTSAGDSTQRGQNWKTCNTLRAWILGRFCTIYDGSSAFVLQVTEQIIQQCLSHAKSLVLSLDVHKT